MAKSDDEKRDEVLKYISTNKRTDMMILQRMFDKVPDYGYARVYNYLAGQMYIELDLVEQCVELTPKGKDIIERGGFVYVNKINDPDYIKAQKLKVAEENKVLNEAELAEKNNKYHVPDTEKHKWNKIYVLLTAMLVLIAIGTYYISVQQKPVKPIQIIIPKEEPINKAKNS